MEFKAGDRVIIDFSSHPSWGHWLKKWNGMVGTFGSYRRRPGSLSDCNVRLDVGVDGQREWYIGDKYLKPFSIAKPSWEL